MVVAADVRGSTDCAVLDTWNVIVWNSTLGRRGEREEQVGNNSRDVWLWERPQRQDVIRACWVCFDR